MALYHTSQAPLRSSKRGGDSVESQGQLKDVLKGLLCFSKLSQGRGILLQNVYQKYLELSV